MSSDKHSNISRYLPLSLMNRRNNRMNNFLPQQTWDAIFKASRNFRAMLKEERLYYINIIRLYLKEDSQYFLPFVSYLTLISTNQENQEDNPFKILIDFIPKLAQYDKEIARDIRPAIIAFFQAESQNTVLKLNDNTSNLIVKIHQDPTCLLNKECDGQDIITELFIGNDNVNDSKKHDDFSVLINKYADIRKKFLQIIQSPLDSENWQAYLNAIVKNLISYTPILDIKGHQKYSLFISHLINECFDSTQGSQLFENKKIDYIKDIYQLLIQTKPPLFRKLYNQDSKDELKRFVTQILAQEIDEGGIQCIPNICLPILEKVMEHHEHTLINDLSDIKGLISYIVKLNPCYPKDFQSLKSLIYRLFNQHSLKSRFLQVCLAAFPEKERDKFCHTLLRFLNRCKKKDWINYVKISTETTVMTYLLSFDQLVNSLQQRESAKKCLNEIIQDPGILKEDIIFKNVDAAFVTHNKFIKFFNQKNTSDKIINDEFIDIDKSNEDPSINQIKSLMNQNYTCPPSQDENLTDDVESINFFNSVKNSQFKFFSNMDSASSNTIGIEDGFLAQLSFFKNQKYDEHISLFKTMCLYHEKIGEKQRRSPMVANGETVTPYYPCLKADLILNMEPKERIKFLNKIIDHFNKLHNDAREKENTGKEELTNKEKAHREYIPESWFKQWLRLLEKFDHARFCKILFEGGLINFFIDRQLMFLVQSSMTSIVKYPNLIDRMSNGQLASICILLDSYRKNMEAELLEAPDGFNNDIYREILKNNINLLESFKKEISNSRWEIINKKIQKANDYEEREKNIVIERYIEYIKSFQLKEYKKSKLNIAVYRITEFLTSIRNLELIFPIEQTNGQIEKTLASLLWEKLFDIEEYCKKNKLLNKKSIYIHSKNGECFSRTIKELISKSRKIVYAFSSKIFSFTRDEYFVFKHHDLKVDDFKKLIVLDTDKKLIKNFINQIEKEKIILFDTKDWIRLSKEGKNKQKISFFLNNTPNLKNPSLIKIRKKTYTTFFVKNTLKKEENEHKEEIEEMDNHKPLYYLLKSLQNKCLYLNDYYAALSYTDFQSLLGNSVSTVYNSIVSLQKILEESIDNDNDSDDSDSDDSDSDDSDSDDSDIELSNSKKEVEKNSNLWDNFCINFIKKIKEFPLFDSQINPYNKTKEYLEKYILEHMINAFFPENHGWEAHETKQLFELFSPAMTASICKIIHVHLVNHRNDYPSYKKASHYLDQIQNKVTFVKYLFKLYKENSSLQDNRNYFLFMIAEIFCRIPYLSSQESNSLKECYNDEKSLQTELKKILLNKKIKNFINHCQLEYCINLNVVSEAPFLLDFNDDSQNQERKDRSMDWRNGPDLLNDDEAITQPIVTHQPTQKNTEENESVQHIIPSLLENLPFSDFIDLINLAPETRESPGQHLLHKIQKEKPCDFAARLVESDADSFGNRASYFLTHITDTVFEDLVESKHISEILDHLFSKALKNRFDLLDEEKTSDDQEKTSDYDELYTGSLDLVVLFSNLSVKKLNLLQQLSCEKMLTPFLNFFKIRPFENRYIQTAKTWLDAMILVGLPRKHRLLYSDLYIYDKFTTEIAEKWHCASEEQKKLLIETKTVEIILQILDAPDIPPPSYPVDYRINQFEANRNQIMFIQSVKQDIAETIQRYHSNKQSNERQMLVLEQITDAYSNKTFFLSSIENRKKPTQSQLKQKKDKNQKEPNIHTLNNNIIANKQLPEINRLPSDQDDKKSEDNNSGMHDSQENGSLYSNISNVEDNALTAKTGRIRDEFTKCF
jgi:hypothetical protein